MEDPVDHTLGRSIQVGIHGEKLLVDSRLALIRHVRYLEFDYTAYARVIEPDRPRPIHWNID